MNKKHSYSALASRFSLKKGDYWLKSNYLKNKITFSSENFQRRTQFKKNYSLQYKIRLNYNNDREKT